VLFPFVPVMPIILPGHNSKKRAVGDVRICEDFNVFLFAAKIRPKRRLKVFDLLLVCDAKFSFGDSFLQKVQDVDTFSCKSKNQYASSRIIFPEIVVTFNHNIIITEDSEGSKGYVDHLLLSDARNTGDNALYL